LGIENLVSRKDYTSQREHDGFRVLKKSAGEQVVEGCLNTTRLRREYNLIG
jgi:hypothetical protein